MLVPLYEVDLLRIEGRDGACEVHQVLQHHVEVLHLDGIDGLVVDLLPLAPALNEAGILQRAEVVRNRGAGHAGYGGDVGDAALVVAEQPENAHAGTV